MLLGHIGLHVFLIVTWLTYGDAGDVTSDTTTSTSSSLFKQGSSILTEAKEACLRPFWICKRRTTAYVLHQAAATDTPHPTPGAVVATTAGVTAPGTTELDEFKAQHQWRVLEAWFLRRPGVSVRPFEYNPSVETPFPIVLADTSQRVPAFPSTSCEMPFFGERRVDPPDVWHQDAFDESALGATELPMETLEPTHTRSTKDVEDRKSVDSNQDWEKVMEFFDEETLSASSFMQMLPTLPPVETSTVQQNTASTTPNAPSTLPTVADEQTSTPSKRSDGFMSYLSRILHCGASSTDVDNDVVSGPEMPSANPLRRRVLHIKEILLNARYNWIQPFQPVFVPHAGNFVFVAVSIEPHRPPYLHHVALTRRSDGRIRLAFKGGEYSVEPFILYPSSPFATLFNKAGNEFRLMMLSQRGDQHFFFRVNDRLIGLVDSRFTLCHIPHETAVDTEYDPNFWVNWSPETRTQSNKPLLRTDAGLNVVRETVRTELATTAVS